MARKKKEEEHVNLERWMVSYADFMTLLFATFVVLYALAQIDLKEFSKLEESIRSAFNSASDSPIEGGQNVLDGSGETFLSQGMADTNSVIPPILEYLNPKYETKSMDAIKNDIDSATKEGSISGVTANITDRGLVITLNDINAFFGSGSAELTPAARKVIDNIAKMITQRFNKHIIRIEGHTDNLLVSTNRFPSNWELSSARSSSVARYLISKYQINPGLLTVVGYGDTKPLASNATPEGRAKNRRIEIVILKNQVAKYEPLGEDTISPYTEKKNQERAKFRKDGLSDAAQELLKDNDASNNDVIVLDEFHKEKNEDVKEALDNFEQGKTKARKKINSKI